MPSKARPKAAKRSTTVAAKSTPVAPRKTAATKGRKPAGKVGPSGGWREESLSRVRALIMEADPDVVEEVKWRKPSNAMKGVPVWSRHGVICTGETYKDKVKFTFMRGAALDDPTGLFNADDRGATRRAIDLREGEMVDAQAFKALIKGAIAMNGPPEQATARTRR